MSCIFSCFSCFLRSSQTTPLAQPIHRSSADVNTSKTAKKALGKSPSSESAPSLNGKNIKKQTNSGSIWLSYIFNCIFGSSSAVGTNQDADEKSDSLE